VRVWIDDAAPQALRDAIRAGGGELAALEDANAIVWYGPGPDPRPLAPLLRDEIEWVQLNSAGVDHWIAADVLDDRRAWSSLRGGLGVPVAEHAMALILASLRRLGTLARSGRWERLEGELLSGKTVGVLGAGGIGRELIRMLQPFHTRILAVTEPVEEVPGAHTSLGADGTDELLRESDIVALGMPLTRLTKGIIGRRELDLIGARGWLVNVARGGLVQTDALVDALREGRLAGAALDVTDPEPLPDQHPLWTMQNVLITPHVANSEAMGRASFVERVRANVERFRRGEELLGVIDVPAEWAQSTLRQ
jgi:D-3-phosphoglycerate dehydrogenase